MSRRVINEEHGPNEMPKLLSYVDGKASILPSAQEILAMEQTNGLRMPSEFRKTSEAPRTPTAKRFQPPKTGADENVDRFQVQPPGLEKAFPFSIASTDCSTIDATPKVTPENTQTIDNFRDNIPEATPRSTPRPSVESRVTPSSRASFTPRNSSSVSTPRPSLDKPYNSQSPRQSLNRPVDDTDIIVRHCYDSDPWPKQVQFSNIVQWSNPIDFLSSTTSSTESVSMDRAGSYVNFDTKQIEHQQDCVDHILPSRLARYYTGGALHHESDWDVINFTDCRYERGTKHYVRVAKTKKNPHGVLLLFDSSPGEMDKFCSISLKPKDGDGSSFALSRQEAIVGQFETKVVASTIMSICTMSLQSHAFLNGFCGSDPNNVNIGQKVVFEARKPYRVGFICDVLFRHGSNQLAPIFEVAFHEEKCSSLKELKKLDSILTKFFQWNVECRRQCKGGCWKEIPNPHKPTKGPLADTLKSAKCVHIHYCTKNNTFLQNVGQAHQVFADADSFDEFTMATPAHRISVWERERLIDKVVTMRDGTKYNKFWAELGFRQTHHCTSFVQHLIKVAMPGLSFEYNSSKSKVLDENGHSIKTYDPVSLRASPERTLLFVKVDRGLPSALSPKTFQPAVSLV